MSTTKNQSSVDHIDPDRNITTTKKIPIGNIITNAGIDTIENEAKLEGPFSCPRAYVPGSYQALGVSTQILAFCGFLRILFGRYIYSPLEGFIIITDWCMFVR